MKYYLLLCIALSYAMNDVVAQCNTLTDVQMEINRPQCAQGQLKSDLIIEIIYSKLAGGQLCLDWNYTVNWNTNPIDKIALSPYEVTNAHITYLVSNVGCDMEVFSQATILDKDCLSLIGMPCPNFPITIGNAPTPVELAYFRGRVLDNSVILEWRTESETNNEGFEVQRSDKDGRFITIDFISGHGTTTETKDYQFIDYNPKRGSTYYRLKQIDFDGQSEYSETIEVRKLTDLDGIKISPNPMSVGENGQIIIESAEEYYSSLVISDPSGKVLYNADHTLMSGFNAISLPQTLSKGIYFVSIRYGYTRFTQKLIVL